MATLTPILCATPGNPLTYNPSVAETFSWVPIENDIQRPLFARAGYITNLSDISVSLSAGNLNVGAVEIKDGNSTRVADVEEIGNGFNALRVLTQALDSSADSVAIGDSTGNTVTIEPATSALNVNITNSAPIQASITSDVSVNFAQSPNFDSFGRLRTSAPHTLFDSSHRYSDNGLWATQAVNGAATFNSSQGLVDLQITGGSGSLAVRETTKVFSYQPGKSLLVMNSFVFSPAATSLIQRVGYFNDTNGFFLQMNGSSLEFVRRSSSLVTTEIKAQGTWSEDNLDGTGPSGINLDISKVQILWMDFEWLGAGTVRMGFVIDGKFIICHKFHHANVVASTYINTACLPLRYEIRNSGAPTATYTLKQICSTVLSEGGYELRGEQRSVNIPLGSPRDLAVVGTYYPLITLRLKSSREDAVVILSNLSFLGTTNNANYHWEIIGRGVTAGGSGTWVSAGADSSVEYKLDATSITGGKVLASGYTTGSNQGSIPVNISKENLFQFQLERDGLNNNYYELTLAVATDNSGADAYAAFDWEEITR